MYHLFDNKSKPRTMPGIEIGIRNQVSNNFLFRHFSRKLDDFNQVEEKIKILRKTRLNFEIM